MDYILLLQSRFPDTQDDLINYAIAMEEMHKVAKEKRLRFLKVRWQEEGEDREDYVLEAPHDIAEEIGLHIKFSQWFFNVVPTQVHTADADWLSIIRNTKRHKKVPIVRIRTLLGQ